MKKSIIILSVLIFLTLICFNISVAGWLEIEDNSFFDPSNIVYTKQGSILVWMKNTLNDSAIGNHIAQNTYMKDTNYEDYSYSVGQFEYDCNKKLMRLIYEYDYDKYDKVINFLDYHDVSNFKRVVPNSRGEYKLNEVCNFAINDKEKDDLDNLPHPLPNDQAPKINNSLGKWLTN